MKIKLTREQIVALIANVITAPRIPKCVEIEEGNGGNIIFTFENIREVVVSENGEVL
jgi:hypothetical protein